MAFQYRVNIQGSDDGWTTWHVWRIRGAGSAARGDCTGVYQVPPTEGQTSFKETLKALLAVMDSPMMERPQRPSSGV